MIRLVDYGVGNIQAFLNAFKRVGLPAARARTPQELSDATRLILPGVGSFDHAMQLFNQSGLRETVETMVHAQRIPVLGVCVGMQMLAGSSEEGELPGLNWIPGQVRAFAGSSVAAQLPMPHMGWNDVNVHPVGKKLFTGLDSSPRFYFLHSYYFDAENREHVAASATYGIEFDCVVSNEHIHGIQCHPEKSHHFGVQLLKNFAEL